MPKLSIDSNKIDYDIIDAKDKIIIIRPPYYLIQHEYDSLVRLGKALKNNTDAKYIMMVCKDVDYETMDIDEAINMINSTIDELYHIKEELMGEYEDGE